MSRILMGESLKVWEGKTVAHVETDTSRDCLNMASMVKIHFTDGACLWLSTDWRGNTCYISQYAERKPSPAEAQEASKVRLDKLLDRGPWGEKRKGWRYRSAVTGGYVTAEYAKANPDTTVREFMEAKK